MLELLFNFFQNLFVTHFEDYDGDMPMMDITFRFSNDVNETPLCLGDYLALICSIISLIFIVVLCCLFVYKIIKLIGGLIR